MEAKDQSQPTIKPSRSRRIGGLVAIVAGLTFGLILLAPAVSGLERTVVSGDAHSPLSGGSVVFSERVERSSLAVGDLVSFRAPGETTGTITREISATLPNAGTPLFQVAGPDGEAAWLRLTDATQLKAALTLPAVGYLVEAAATPAIRIFLILLPLAFLASAFIGAGPRRTGGLTIEPEIAAPMAPAASLHGPRVAR